MSTLVITLLRYGFLILLWLMIIAVMKTVVNDVNQNNVKRSRKRAPRKNAPAPALSGAAQPLSATANSHSANPAQTPELSGIDAQRNQIARTGVAAYHAQPYLLVTRGPLAGTTISLNSGSVLVGRSPDSALVLDDGYASARHARFFQQGEQIFVEDLSSTNGTWIGSERLFHAQPLAPGVPVTIGKTTLELAI